MATVIRNTDPATSLWVAAHNDLKKQIGAASFFHLDVSEKTLTATNATTLPTALTQVNEMLTWYAFHMADTLAHKVAGVALASYVKATDLASAILRANDVKAKYNVHRAATTYHYTADSTNAVTATDSSDLATLLTLLADIKAQINAHLASGQTAKSLRLVGA